MALPPALLRLNGVSYAPNGVPLLQDLSFTLAAGEFVMLRGPSGSGKSTLLQLIAAMLTPDEGRIVFEGQDIASLEPTAYRRAVSYGFQSPQLFGESVYDNLAFPYRIRHQPVDEARIHHGLAEMALPAGVLGKAPTALSGGERQRVALLRNLQVMPQLLLLDEVTSALDEENKRRVGDVIRTETARHGTVVLWVSHDPQEGRHASRELWLDQQRLRRRPTAGGVA